MREQQEVGRCFLMNKLEDGLLFMAFLLIAGFAPALAELIPLWITPALLFVIPGAFFWMFVKVVKA